MCVVLHIVRVPSADNRELITAGWMRALMLRWRLFLVRAYIHKFPFATACSAKHGAHISSRSASSEGYKRRVPDKFSKEAARARGRPCVCGLESFRNNLLRYCKVGRANASRNSLRELPIGAKWPGFCMQMRERWLRERSFLPSEK